MDDQTRLLPDFRALFDAAPNLYLVLSPDLVIAAASDAYCRATLTEREAIIGRRLFDVFPDDPDDPAATGSDTLRASLTRVLRFRRPDAMAVRKHDIRRPDSEGGGFEERQWAPLNSPVLDEAGEVAWIIHRVEDVTEMVGQRETIERLRKTSRHLDAVVDNLPGILFIKSLPDLRYVLINRAGEALLGYGRTEYVGKTDHDVFPKEQADGLAANDRAALDSGQALVVEETISTRAKGVRTLRTIKVPVKDKAGSPEYLLGYSEDITEREAIEQQLRQAAKMEAVGQLTGGIAHDFNNLLGIIIGNLDVALEHPDPAHRAVLEEALNGALRGAELTRRLLAFSRKRSLQAAIVDLNQDLPRIAGMLRQTLGEQATVELHQEPELWPVEVDPAQLDEAVLNLANNARDAMPRGGKVGIEARNVRLDRDHAAANPGTAPGDYVQLSVSDSGTGMSPQTIERCFEPFFTTKNLRRGAGLGLSMVYGFVRQSSGHVKIRSELGRGTTVTIQLPRAAAAAADTDARPAMPEAAPAPGGGLVLMVDDDKDLRAVTLKQLADLGYRTLEAENAKAALNILAERSDIDLLLTDIMMPGGMTGIELAREARRLYPKLKILLTSGYVARAIAGGLDDIEDLDLLKKPFRKRDLAQRVTNALRRG